MEVTEMLAMHSILVEIFLAFLVMGLLTPAWVKSSGVFKKASLIYTMVFQALATMIAFAGLVAVVAGDLGWHLTTNMMVAVWGVMMYVEIKKYKLVKIANLEHEQTFKVIKGAFLKISVVQILLVAGMFALMMLKVNGAISL
ncbi:hypothetical protein MNB_SV-3-746 [hydrothermal vent metagenome]|uniref:Uncharacterized protein n=1 Tax=hydrothermal vent metagenome TaxID=652676 RepID=A0A1W1CWN2_9ZZZZ